jgi:hypothetical protein
MLYLAEAIQEGLGRYFLEFRSILAKIGFNY